MQRHQVFLHGFRTAGTYDGPVPLDIIIQPQFSAALNYQSVGSLLLPPMQPWVHLRQSYDSQSFLVEPEKVIIGLYGRRTVVEEKKGI